MNIVDTKIIDVKRIDPLVYSDQRGYFFESFHQQNFEDGVGYSVQFVQDNHSSSTKGVLRGLHYQLPPHAQGKLVRVVQGEVFDVAVDIRQSSPTFGQWVGEVLSAENKRQLWIPPGFAHGFITLSDSAEFLYKTTNYYCPEAERTIHWQDAEINIDWLIVGDPIVSSRDNSAASFNEAELFD